MIYILSIDPGPTQSAIIVWDGKQIVYKNIAENYKVIQDELYYIGAPCDMVMVIEQIKSYGMAVSDSIFDTVFWTGRIIQKWEELTEHKGKWYRVPRREVKMHLCGSMRAKDSNIRQALIDRFGEPGTKKNQGLTYGLSKDLWAAFALGVYWLDTKAKEV